MRTDPRTAKVTPERGIRQVAGRAPTHFKESLS
jgi:hypothetical protein